jgi:hypothetical protein
VESTRQRREIDKLAENPTLQEVWLPRCCLAKCTGAIAGLLSFQGRCVTSLKLFHGAFEYSEANGGDRTFAQQSLDVVRTNLRWFFLHEEQCGGVELVVGNRFQSLANKLLLGVEVGITLHLGGGHVGEDPALVGGAPGGVVEPYPGGVEVQMLVGECMGVGAQIAYPLGVVLHSVEVFLNEGQVGFRELVILLDLAMDALAGLADKMAMMHGFERALQTEGDEETEGDGTDVNEEVAPAVDALVGWVNVENGGLLPW